jgi:hypothetical protein
MDDDKGTKSVKLPTFDGEMKKFQLWWVWFAAYATVFKFIKALAIGGETILAGVQQDTVIPDTDTDKDAKEAAQNQNALESDNGIHKWHDNGIGLQGNDNRLARWTGTCGGGSFVQEVPTARHDHQSWVETDVEWCQDEERKQSSNYIWAVNHYQK